MREAPSRGEKSGWRAALTGVGTAMITKSASRMRAGSSVTSSFAAARRSSPETSPVASWNSFSRWTFLAARS